MTAEIHKKPREDKDTSARGGKRGKVMMDEERERERKSGRTAQSLRSKGGRDGENSDKNKGSLSLYLAASRVALVSGGGGGGGSSSIIRARSTFFLLTRGRHGDKRSVQRGGVLGSQISQSALHCRTVLASWCGSSVRSSIRTKSGHCPFRTSSTRRHAW